MILRAVEFATDTPVGRKSKLIRFDDVYSFHAGGELKRYAKAPFHVLSDLDGGYALELNLLFWVGDDMRQAMTAGGVDIAPFQGNETWMLPVPATFIVGQDGCVTARFVDPDYRRRIEIDDLIDALRSRPEDKSPNTT